MGPKIFFIVHGSLDMQRGLALSQIQATHIHTSWHCSRIWLGRPLFAACELAKRSLQHWLPGALARPMKMACSGNALFKEAPQHRRTLELPKAGQAGLRVLNTLQARHENAQLRVCEKIGHTCFMELSGKVSNWRFLALVAGGTMEILFFAHPAACQFGT